MPERLFEEHIPRGLNQAILDYARETVLKHSRYLFVQKQGRGQLAFCTHCRLESRVSGLRHNAATVCPECGSSVMVKSAGMGRKHMIDTAYFVWYQKSQIDPTAIVARGIYAIRDYRHDYTSVKTQFKAIAQYVFMPGQSAMRSRYIFYDPNLRAVRIFEWRQAARVHSLFGKGCVAYIPCFCSYDNIRAAVTETPFQYSTWYDYSSPHNMDLTRFFSLYAKYPCVEYLTKSGFEGLVQAKLDGNPTFAAINWRGKNILKVLKLSKAELIELKRFKIHISFLTLHTMQVAKKNNWGLTVAEVAELSTRYTSYDFGLIKDLAAHSSFKQVVRYLLKQYNDYNHEKGSHFYNSLDVLHTYRDYIADCVKLRLNLGDERVLFPKNLSSAHRETNKRIMVQNNPETNRKIQRRAAGLQKYCFEYQDLFIRPAASFEELIDEGAILDHCVAKNYAETYANGKTNILFIRKLSDPETPFFTVELRAGRIIQVHGLHNCSPTEEVLAFIEAFARKKLDKRAIKKAV